MNEILDGIKVLKMYAWEPSFAKKIQKIRNEEVATLKKMSYLGAVQTFMFTAAPFMVSLASFATFVLVDEANILNAEVAFVSLSYFNLMRMPLNQVFKKWQNSVHVVFECHCKFLVPDNTRKILMEI